MAEIEKQFTRIDASVDALERAQANLKRYRASVLKAACEGRLVPTEAELARAEGRDYEHADELLERILAERRARWESPGEARSQVQGACRAGYVRPAGTAGGVGVVQHWLAQVSASMLGNMLDRKRTTGIYLPYLRNLNVRWDSV